jgi:hypothetical protein
VTFTATPTGGAAPQQYKWFLWDGKSWTVLLGWSTSNRYAWTPPSPNSNYRIGVWVRSGTSTGDSLEASTEYGYPVW